MNFIQVGSMLNHYIILVDRTAAYFLAAAYGALVVGVMYLANLHQPKPSSVQWRGRDAAWKAR